MVYRLTYVSAVSSLAMTALAAEMQDILAVSVFNNRRDGLTGLLLCDGDLFAQVLEGDQPLVEACFARILGDRRNVGPIVRERGLVEERLFPRWSMCALTLSPRDDALLTPADTGYDLARASAGALLQTLASVAERHGPQLDAEHAQLLRRA
jgi:hypothetical protein